MVISIGTAVNDFLGFFGARGGAIGAAIDSMPLIGSPAGVLQNLQDAYIETAMGRGTGFMERLMMQGGGGWGSPFFVPSPMSQYGSLFPYAGGGYAAGGIQTIDLAQGSSNIPFVSQLFDPRRRMAAQMERMMRSNPHARAAFEAQIGGRVIDFGIRNDGVMHVQRFAPGYFPGMFASQPMVGNIYGYLNGMNTAVLNQAAYMGGVNPGMVPNLGLNSFYGYAGMGLNNVLNGSYVPQGMVGPAGYGAGPFDNSGAMGGRGAGSWNPNAMPGQINNTNPYYENAHQSEAAALLADPSLTVEDKVTLLIMLIMKKMDQDIERQAQYINSIQNQQSARGNQQGTNQGGTTQGTNAFGQTDNSSPSIDVETMKLKRMIDKRGQMFDMLRQIIDKYNETAKNIIQSMGR